MIEINKPNKYLYEVTWFDNYDGDSVNIKYKITFDCGFEETITKRGTLKVRLYGVDTPEIRGGTTDSKAAANMAKKFVHDWLKWRLAANQVLFLSKEYKKGKFGRALGDFIDSDSGESLTDKLIYKKLGVKYYGQSKDDIQADHEANIQYLKSTGAL